ncbi:MAG TPA: diguanylate cyclase [Acidobacteriota bacterium]|nr:diguanylate cyclase [Acidobacteriota bacterium]
MKRPDPKVLILDDDPSVTGLLADVMKLEGYEVLESNSSKDVLFLARQFRPDVLLLDLMMPEVDGCDVCGYFRNDPELRHTRIIVLTARDDQATKVRCYQAGADIFLSKPFELDELRQIVQNHVASKLGTDQLIEELRNMTVHDPASNCFNRRYMERRIVEELRRLERSHRQVALVLMDLDHFNQINLRYGFGFGNDVLKNVVEAIRHELRDIDLLGRYGEDSFLILLPDTTPSGAKSVVSRIQKVISSLVFLKKKRLVLHANMISKLLQKGAKLEDTLKTLENDLERVKQFKAGKAD